MAQYRAIFVCLEGLSEKEVGPSYGLAATERGEAVDEALKLPRPEGANFIKLLRDSQYEAERVGFAL